MGKSRRRIATVATIAALGGLGAAAYESNPASHGAVNGTLVAAHTPGRPIVTGSSGSAALPVSQNAAANAPGTHRPVVTRTSGGGTPGELKDD